MNATRIIIVSIISTLVLAISAFMVMITVIIPRTAHVEKAKCLVVEATVNEEYDVVNVLYRPDYGADSHEYNNYILYDPDAEIPTTFTCWVDQREKRRAVSNQTDLYIHSLICFLCNAMLFLIPFTVVIVLGIRMADQ